MADRWFRVPLDSSLPVGDEYPDLTYTGPKYSDRDDVNGYSWFRVANSPLSVVRFSAPSSVLEDILSNNDVVDLPNANVEQLYENATGTAKPIAELESKQGGCFANT